MPDYQRTVEEIRCFLLLSVQALTDELKILAAAYAAACRDVNQRLARCEEFLNKGLRSEAIHLAQAEPALLEVVAVLDFPERPQWEEVLVYFGLPPAPRLLLE